MFRPYEVSEIKGLKSLRVMNAYSSLLLGVKMMPEYMHLEYNDFLGELEKASDKEKLKVFFAAASFVQLEQSEVEAIVSFCKDQNGVPYSPENIKNLGPKELIDIIVSVCFEMSKIKIDLITDEEKKK